MSVKSVDALIVSVIRKKFGHVFFIFKPEERNDEKAREKCEQRSP